MYYDGSITATWSLYHPLFRFTLPATIKSVLSSNQGSTCA